MENYNVESVDNTTAGTSYQDGDDCHPQQNILTETKPVSSLHAGIDSASGSLFTPKKKSSQEAQELSSKILGKSPRSKTPFKHQKQTPPKTLKKLPKKLFRTPSKSKESKNVKQSGDDVTDEPDIKSKKLQNKGESSETGLPDEMIGEFDDVSESLEQKAVKAKMNTRNVKSMIHHVLKNEHVFNMFKDVLESEQQAVSGQSSPRKKDVASGMLDYVPKMTRAKVKEFLEKISMPSPAKATKDGPSILDVEFNEEEDDDEYNPEKDEECPESDDESITSSKLSEFGSPYRDITSTPVITPSRESMFHNTISRVTTTDTSADLDMVSTSARNVDNMLPTVSELSGEEVTDGVDTIALRTRSKLPLTSTSIMEIESAFVAPDITTDMYDTNCDDADWAQFLSSLYKTTDDTITDDDADANDPEFNYIAEAEREQLDEEDFRFDKPTKITKKELAAMISDLSDLFEDEVLPYQAVASASEVTGNWVTQSGGQDVPSASAPFTDLKALQTMPSSSSAQFTKFKAPRTPPSRAHVKCRSFEPSQTLEQQLVQSYVTTGSSNNRESDLDSIVTQEQRTLIEDNMRKHTQLLLQSFMLCQNSQLLAQDSAEPKSMIVELNYLRQASPAGENSVFGVCNLDPAVELVSNSTLFENREGERSSGFGRNQGGEFRCALSQTQKLAIYNSPAFVYPHLLPILIKLRENDRKYSKFFRSEDNLIALGLDQFNDYNTVNPIELIHELLIRGKSLDQIVCRVQYMSSGRVGDNPIKCVKRTGKLPADFPTPTVDHFYPMAPKDQMSHLLPVWCSSLKYSRAVTSQRKIGIQRRLSASSNESTTMTVLAQPAPIGQLSQQGNQEMSGMSIQIPRQCVDHMQQTVPVQIQPPFNISQISQPITYQNSQAVQVPSDLPQITGIYIQFATPAPLSRPVATTLRQDSSVVALPQLAPKARALRKLGSRNSEVHNKKSIKRKASSSVGTSASKRKVTKTSSVTDWDATPVSNTDTQTENCASPDLLAKTLMSCGIEESPVCPSSQSHFPFNNGLYQLGMSFSSSTPIDQDKHPSVRNLNWEFDAAHRQSPCSNQTIQTEDTEKTAELQSQTLPTLASVSQSSITGSLTSALPEQRLNDMPILPQVEPDASGQPMEEQAPNFRDMKENDNLCTNSSLLSNSDPLCSEHIVPMDDDCIDNHNVNSHSQASADATFLQNSNTLNADEEKQSPSTISQRNIEEHKISREYQCSSDSPTHGHLLLDSTSEPHSCTSTSENVQTVISESASTFSDHNGSVISETVVDLHTVQTAATGLSEENDKSHVNDTTGTNSKVDAEHIFPAKTDVEHIFPAKTDAEHIISVNTDVEHIFPAKTDVEHIFPAKTDAEHIFSAKTDVEHIFPAKTDVEHIFPAKTDAEHIISAKTDAEHIFPVKTDTEHIFPAKTAISSDSVDNTVVLVSAPTESISNCADFESPVKPKTIRQMLEASERMKAGSDKGLATSSNCVLGMINPVTGSASPFFEIMKSNQSEHDRTLLKEDSEPSLSDQQMEISPPHSNTVAVFPLNSVALIAFHSPAKFEESSSSHASPFKTPTKLRPLLAKALSPASLCASPYVPLPKMSPKRKELNRHVRQILPKSFVFEIKSPSPTKTAAQVLKKRATLYCQNRSPVKLLPKKPQAASSGASRAKPLVTPTRMFTRSQKTKVKNTAEIKMKKKVARPAVKDPPPDKEKEMVEPEMSEAEDAGLSQEEEEEEFEDEDQSQLDDLMAACTTIGYDPKKGSSGTDSDNKSKAQRKRDICLSMLEPDIIDTDPKKDERDTAYAQHYFTHVKQVLRDDPKRFKKFLTILHNMNKNHMDPVELYADMATLLSNHQDLVDDFAGFLLSFQAVKCNCFISYLEYQQILTFLRRLETYCDNSHLNYQRTLKMMSRWLTMLNLEAQSDTTPLKEKISALLRHVPKIDDLVSYFFGTPLPDSHPDDFEEVDLVEDVVGDVDEFEEIILPESLEDYNTKLCSCKCHQDQQDEKLRRRIKHCFSCSLKIFNGKPVLKTSRNEYRPITVLYPLEEKEKMMKAKKEAAQLALAKARAQRRQNKKKGKKKKIGSLKCKNSKNTPLKKKFKRRKRRKSQSDSTEAGNASKTICEIENKNSDMRDDTNAVCQKQGKSDTKSTNRKLSYEQPEIGGGKLTEGSADVTISAVSDKTIVSTDNNTSQSSVPVKMETVTDEVAATSAHLPAETVKLSALKSTLESEPSLARKEALSKSGIKNMVAKSVTEPIVSESAQILTPSVKSPLLTSDAHELKLAPVASLGRTASLDSCLTSSDKQIKRPSLLKGQQSQIRTSEPNIIQSQLLSVPTLPVSCISSGVTVSQTNSLSSPVVSSSQPQTSAYVAKDSRTAKPSSFPVMASQNVTFVPCAPHLRFTTASPLVTSTRIPVIVTLNPQQYLPSASPILKTETHRPRRKSPQRSDSVVSLSSPQQISSAEPTNYRCENQQQDSHLHIASSDPICLQQNRVAISDPSPSFPSSAEDTEMYIVPQMDICPTITDIANCRSDTLISSSSVTSFTDVPCTFSTSDNPNIGACTSSATKLNSTLDLQQSDIVCSLPTTPLKEKIPAAVVHAHLDNFSLGGFEGSFSYHQLQQFAQSVSPSKLLTDSMSKFDLLALIESSNLSCKNLTLQASSMGSAARTTTEPLTFSGALAKLKATSEEPTMTSSAAAYSSQSISTCDTMEDLPTTCGVTESHDEASVDYVMSEETNSGCTKVTEDELRDLCPHLNSSKLLQDDESSNAFELSVWTEEQDRTILNVVTVERVTKENVKKLHSQIPEKSPEEISFRAKLLLRMLEEMGDTESDTDTDTSHDDQSEHDI